MRKHAIVSLLLLSCFGWAPGQDPTPQLDGIQHPFRDDFLSRMCGTWTLTGTIRGKNVRHTLDVQWVLNHQFLQIHEKDTAAPGQPGWYEAIGLIGFDNRSERYLIHWNDVFGGRFSETLGYGARSGDEIAFVFEYPDGPFRTVYRWNPERKQWKWQMRSKNAKGQWEEFADLTQSR